MCYARSLGNQGLWFKGFWRKCFRTEILNMIVFHDLKLRLPFELHEKIGSCRNSFKVFVNGFADYIWIDSQTDA